MAFSSKLGAIRHRANAIQVDDYKSSYSGRAAEVLHWFKGLRTEASELADKAGKIQVPTLVFWGELGSLKALVPEATLHGALACRAGRCRP